MKAREEIIEILQNEFYCVGCSNCNHKGTGSYECDGCARYDSNWTISEKLAREIADEILNQL